MYHPDLKLTTPRRGCQLKMNKIFQTRNDTLPEQPFHIIVLLMREDIAFSSNAFLHRRFRRATRTIQGCVTIGLEFNRINRICLILDKSQLFSQAL